jgi:hypothetical protein
MVDLLKLANSLEAIHELNVTQLDQDFARYANLTGKTEFDFKTVTSELRKFQHIQNMQNFNPLDVKWNRGNCLKYSQISVLGIHIGIIHKSGFTLLQML